MILRSLRERLLQTLLFEAGGLLVAAPLYSLVAGGGARYSFAVVGAVSLAVMTWSPIHNTLFDAADYLLSGRLASERPQGLRICHALSHEVSSTLVSLPVILLMTLYDLVEAIVLDIGLGIVYTAYAFVFHNLFDRWRPLNRIG